MDAAAGLLLLGVLILLCKEPASEMRIGHPLPTLVAAMLALPVLALMPGALRSWWVVLLAVWWGRPWEGLPQQASCAKCRLSSACLTCRAQ